MSDVHGIIFCILLLLIPLYLVSGDGEHAIWGIILIIVLALLVVVLSINDIRGIQDDDGEDEQDER